MKNKNFQASLFASQNLTAEKRLIFEVGGKSNSVMQEPKTPNLKEKRDLLIKKDSKKLQGLSEEVKAESEILELSEELKRVKEERDIMSKLVGFEACEKLEKQKTLTKSEARILLREEIKDPHRSIRSSSSNDALYLGYLEEMSVEVASILAGFNGEELILDQLEGLPSGVAKELAGFKGKKLNIGLNKLLLSPAAAKELGKFGGEEIIFDDRGKSSMSTESAQALAEFKGGKISFAGISPATAKGLAKYKGKELLINDGELSPAVAKELAKFSGELKFENLEELPPATAKALVGFQGKSIDLGFLVMNEEAVAILRNSPISKIKVWAGADLKGKYIDKDKNDRLITRDDTRGTMVIKSLKRNEIVMGKAEAE